MYPIFDEIEPLVYHFCAAQLNQLKKKRKKEKGEWENIPIKSKCLAMFFLLPLPVARISSNCASRLLARISIKINFHCGSHAILKILLDDQLWVDSSGNYVTVFDGSFVFEKALDEFINLLTIQLIFCQNLMS